MTLIEQMVGRFKSSFPLDPRPVGLFIDPLMPSQDDFHQELGHRLQGRLWTEISLLDWRMVGVHPSNVRHYMRPAAFIYYLPSLLLGSLTDLGFIDFGLEAIIPLGRKRVQKGLWWNEFRQVLSEEQEACLCVFVEAVRRELWDSIGEANQALVDNASIIWPLRERE